MRLPRAARAVRVPPAGRLSSVSLLRHISDISGGTSKNSLRKHKLASMIVPNSRTQSRHHFVL